jgi:choline dehydrogenase-like flavoprotein
VVIAASTIESARLFLLSDLDKELPAVGRFLAEHIERRAKIEVDPLNPEVRGQGISLVVPPENEALESRFQIHLRGQLNQEGKLEVDIGGFAAMDPCEDNRVTLAGNRDEYDVPKAHTSVSISTKDQTRVDHMCDKIRDIARILNGKFVTTRFPFEETTPRFTDTSHEIQEMGLGRSYHEAGTLRMGAGAETNSVTDSGGLVHGFSNLYVADAGLFPCVGIANPMLTITALAYRVADCIEAALWPDQGPQAV